MATDPDTSSTTSRILGPILFLDDVRDAALHLSALVFVTDTTNPDPLICGEGRYPFVEIAADAGWRVLRARFEAAMSAPVTYSVLGQSHTIRTGYDGDLNIAFASCNGEENGDLDRDPDERNAMWARLRDDHRNNPFHLLLHGGDQIYADEVTLGHPLSEDWPESVPKDPERADLRELRAHLRRGFFERYMKFFDTCPAFMELAASVPSLCQWDDHDICDGWGSLPRSRTYSPVGQTLYEVAREATLIFQHACTLDDMPGRFHDKTGLSLGWWIDLPDLRLVAPDLRGERTRRQVMGDVGWAMMEAVAALPPTRQILFISSVPLLGPRLSVLEAAMVVTPKMQEYEDDLRDQWQSRAHRTEWRRMLQLLTDIAVDTGARITAVSGEIHLAARATMPLGGQDTLHQLIASGVAHRPPPQAWAKVLGSLAAFGEGPLDGAPITIERLPGQSGRYVAERNTLAITRTDDAWHAVWDLEDSGKTEPLALAGQ
ncbi:alkaline phosphatase family protein [Tateyamaria omphalii]|uniref:alkaline phosphatase D family protein n=1 Tax=Tateyamaria omphalii TaxID=299262 RepID=UPI001C99531B|nr:alkaline phosphatase D family protein [Tateyamaria omphalii]MBY5934781.1 alkaline phosphatase family protein [Tateyamaria omphalii]